MRKSALGILLAIILFDILTSFKLPQLSVYEAIGLLIYHSLLYFFFYKIISINNVKDEKVGDRFLTTVKDLLPLFLIYFTSYTAILFMIVNNSAKLGSNILVEWWLTEFKGIWFGFYLVILQLMFIFPAIYLLFKKYDSRLILILVYFIYATLSDIGYAITAVLNIPILNIPYVIDSIINIFGSIPMLFIAIYILHKYFNS